MDGATSGAAVPPAPGITMRVERGVGVVVLSGEVTNRVVPVLFRVVDQAVVAAGWPLLILDVTGLDLVEVVVLGAVVAVHRRLRAQGGAVVVYGRCEPFERVARVAGMAHVLTTAVTLHEARYRAVGLSVFTEEQLRQRHPSV